MADSGRLLGTNRSGRLPTAGCEGRREPRVEKFGQLYDEVGGFRDLLAINAGLRRPSADAVLQTFTDGGGAPRYEGPRVEFGSWRLADCVSLS